MNPDLFDFLQWFLRTHIFNVDAGFPNSDGTHSIFRYKQIELRKLMKAEDFMELDDYWKEEFEKWV